MLSVCSDHTTLFPRLQALHDVEAIPAECDGPHDLYSAVLMDFGSAGPRIVEVKSRGEALRLQEDAEVSGKG